MKIIKSGSVRLIAFLALINCLCIAATGFFASEMITKIHTAEEHSNLTKLIAMNEPRTKLIFSFYKSRIFLSEKDFFKDSIEFLGADEDILSFSVFTKTADENYYKVIKASSMTGGRKLPFAEGMQIMESSETNYLKKGLYETSIDEKIYAEDGTHFFNIYIPAKFGKKECVIQISVSAEEYAANSTNIEKHTASLKKTLMIFTIILCIIFGFLTFVQLEQMRAFYKRMSGVAQNAAQGSDMVMNPSVDSDISELALSFNSLVGEIKEKEKIIEELSSKDSLSDIFKFGVNLLKENRFDEASNIFSTLIMLKPDGFGSFFNLGVIFAKKKKYSESLEMFKKALEINPEHDMTKSYISKTERLIQSEKP